MGSLVSCFRSKISERTRSPPWRHSDSFAVWSDSNNDQESLGEQNVVENDVGSLSLNEEIEEVGNPRNLKKKLTQKTTSAITKNELFGEYDGLAKDMDPTGIARIVKISIRHGDVIHALTVHFERNGTTQSTDQWGGNGGVLTEINLKTNEYITSVKGYFNDNYFLDEVVSSLAVETNLAIHGPYGTKKGKSFELPAVDGQIIGFHARAGEFVNAVGVYVKDFVRRKSVLCGGNGGSPKDIDHVGFPHIVKVSIHHGDAIDALCVCYGLGDGTPERTSIWGGNTGVPTEINLKNDEDIMSVRGYVGHFGDLFIVRSLQLITNKRQCGPYGKEEGTPFELSAYNKKIIGFHGHSGAYLDAIGIYAQVALLVIIIAAEKREYNAMMTKKIARALP